MSLGYLLLLISILFRGGVKELSLPSLWIEVLSYIWELIVPHGALCFISHWRSFVGSIVFFYEVPVVDELSFLDLKKIFFLSFPFSPLLCYFLLSYCLSGTSLESCQPHPLRSFINSIFDIHARGGELRG